MLKKARYYFFIPAWTRKCTATGRSRISTNYEASAKLLPRNARTDSDFSMSNTHNCLKIGSGSINESGKDID